MSIQVAVCTAAQLFSSELWGKGNESKTSVFTNKKNFIYGRLVIPEYQRPYRWSSQQIKPLLEDIRNHNNRSKDNENNKKTNKLSSNYYLGSLILHQNAEQLNIIDGQQRLTTLAILSSLLYPNDKKLKIMQENLVVSHQISRQQIIKNIKWLRTFFDSSNEDWQKHIDLNQLQFSLVITQSEDDAYNFFETQNTGGKRLSGPDIIKAHHLRAINDSHYQNQFAMHWESLGELDNVVVNLLKGRFWQTIQLRELPSHRNHNAVRNCIVKEFGEGTGNNNEDIAYGRSRLKKGLAGEVAHHFTHQSYDVRQPLNAGVNSIRYLSYFQQLNQHYWEKNHLPHLIEYQNFINWLKKLVGCGYLKELYKTCLMIYISQFGEEKLDIAAKKIFRVVYSRRVSNQKTVRENSIYAFIKETPVLDWIAQSYTPQQCFSRLDVFKLHVNEDNLKENSYKHRFAKACYEFFTLDWEEELEPKELAVSFKKQLSQKIRALK